MATFAGMPAVKEQHRQDRDRAKKYFANQNTPYWSAQHDTTVSGLRNQRDQSLTSLAGQEINTRQDYGIDDPTNPFSRARQLQQQFQSQRQGATNSFAARGQLYSGALSRRQNTVRSGYEQGQDELLRGYQSALAGINQQRQAATTDYETGVLDAGAKRLEAQANAPQTDPGQTPGYVNRALKRIDRKIKVAKSKGQDWRVKELQQAKQRITNA